MGLPLYRAPVESDIKAKVPKDPPTRARSTIRRNRYAGNDPSSRPASTSAQIYARRGGLGPRVRARLVSPPTADSSWTPWDNIDPGEARTTQRPRLPFPFPHDNTTQDGPDRREPVLREVITRNGPMSQEVVRYFGEHMARLYAGTSPRGNQDWEVGPESERRERMPTPEGLPPLLPVEPLGQPSAPPVLEPPMPSRGDRLRIPADLLRHHNDHLLRMRRSLRAQEFAAMREAHGARREHREARSRLPASSGDVAAQESRFDGLGDRDRSLSPEGDGVWDTLLSSITPDPQPPSVGTSFASTPAPASAASTSQNTASANSANSSHTSLNDGPDGAFANEEIRFAEVCESVGDNSDTEGDEDEEARDNTLRRFGQSYAEGDGRDDDDVEVFGGVESMQRIVRNLARRQDIPDEWWAAAGLSRTLGG